MSLFNLLCTGLIKSGTWLLISLILIVLFIFFKIVLCEQLVNLSHDKKIITFSY